MYQDRWEPQPRWGVPGIEVINAMEVLDAEDECDPFMWIMVKYAERKGYDVKFINAPAGCPLGFCYSGENNKSIFLVNGLSGQQQRFILAYEIAHGLLHEKMKGGSRWYSNDDYYKQIEEKAEDFAVLMLYRIEKRLKKMGIPS